LTLPGNRLDPNCFLPTPKTNSSLAPANLLNAFSQQSRTRFVGMTVNNFNRTASGVGGLRLVADGRGTAFGTWFCCL